MQRQPTTTCLSVDAYLEGELESQVRHEYVDGEIYATVGASDRHGCVPRAGINGTHEAPDMIDWQGRNVRDPDILFGKPRIRGTRMGVEFVLDRLASGWSEAEILEGYPHGTLQDLQAVFAFVRDCMKDETFIIRAAAETGKVPA